MHSDEELRAMCGRLVGILKKEGVPVDYVARGQKRQNGYYSLTGGPNIRVYATSDNDCEPARDSLVTMAHEAGHMRSDQLGTRTQDIERAAFRLDAGVIVSDDFPILMEEECRAWFFGKPWLERIGFDDWSLWEERRIKGLSSYCETYKRSPDDWQSVWEDTIRIHG